MSKNKQGAERSIEATLGALGLQTEDDPEEAAAKAVAGMDQPSEKEEKIHIPAPRSDADGEEGDDADAGDEMTPLPAPLIPAPRIAPPKVNKDKKNTHAAKLGVLALKAPSADKVKIHKRTETGQLEFVSEYTPLDVNRFSDFESFITRYCKPKYGTGEYEITGVDASLRELSLGTVRLIADPPSQSAESNVVGLVDKIITQGREQNEQQIARMERIVQETQANKQDPLGLLTGVMALNEKLEERNGGGKQDAAAIAMAAMAQQTQMMVALLSKPPQADPIMQALLTKLIEDKGSGGSSGALPLPPPPPASGFSTLLEKIDAPMIAAIASLLAVLRPPVKEKDGPSDRDIFLQHLLSQNQSSTLGVKEVIGLLKNNEAPAGDDFTSQIDKIAALINVAKNLEMGQGSAQNGFMDVLAAFAANRDLGAGITRLLSAKLGTGQAQQPASVPPAVVQQIRAAQAEIIEARKQLAIERAALDERARRLNPGEATENTAPTPERVQEAVEKVKENLGEVPVLPPQTKEFLAAIDSATDDVGRARALTYFILYFNDDPGYRPFMQGLIRSTREGGGGNQAKALRFLYNMFNVFVGEGLMKKEAAGPTLKLFKEHFDMFRENFKDVPLDKDGEVTRDSLLAPPGAVAAQ